MYDFYYEQIGSLGMRGGIMGVGRTLAGSKADYKDHFNLDLDHQRFSQKNNLDEKKQKSNLSDVVVKPDFDKGINCNGHWKQQMSTPTYPARYIIDLDLNSMYASSCEYISFFLFFFTKK